MKQWWIVGLIVILVGLFLLWPKMHSQQSVNQPTGQPNELATITPADRAADQAKETSVKRIAAKDINGVADVYQWTALIPSGWQAEAIPEIEAINLYDPTTGGDSSLEQSQIFIRHFEANAFQTLQTVTIHERIDTSVGGRPAVRYEIEKKSGVANFPSQPRWRNQRHVVTDVRVSDSNPSTFYVIAKRPDLDQAICDQFLATLDPSAPLSTGHLSSVQGKVSEPADGFLDRIVKKPFEIHVSPCDSPVQPERFSGYHTGADAEYEDTTDDVEVRAIADGTVEVARTADGYGGVAILKQTIDGVDYHVVYGHLDPADLPKVGSSVKQGDHLGRLGEGGTSETDGERTHLHLGIFKGSAPDLRGYVSRESDLTQWLDPVSLFR